MADPTNKSRKIFNFTGFRGMDTENKPDRVARFRAAKGKNFFIDSDNLKTRPAFINEKFYNVQGNILGSYFFNDTEIIFTDKNYIYFFTKEDFFYTNGISFNAAKKVFTNIFSFSFFDARPFFVQEKDCLFVFCVNDVLVISQTIGEEGSAFVIYSIDNKINITYDDFNEYCSDDNYVILPDAYVPTIQIGDNAFEDVNLLSNKRKYKLFAKADDEETSTYTLLGDYDPEKNGDFNDIKLDIDFYGQNIKEMTQLPTFLGVEGNISEDLENNNLFWVFPDDTDTPNLQVQTIETPIKSKKVWEYREDDTNFENPIVSDTGLTKEEALTIVLPDDKKTIFEFLKDFDFTDFEQIISGRIIIYKVKVIFEYTYKVINDNGVTISAGKKKTAEKEVYFKVHFFETEKDFVILSTNIKKGEIYFSNSENFPSGYEYPIPNTNKENYVEVEFYSDLSGLIPNINTAYFVKEFETFYAWSEKESAYIDVMFIYNDVLPSASNGEITFKQKQEINRWFIQNNDLPEDVEEAFVYIKFTKTIITPPKTLLIDTITFPNVIDDPTLIQASNLFNDYTEMLNADFPILDKPTGGSWDTSTLLENITINVHNIFPQKYKDGDIYEKISSNIINKLDQIRIQKDLPSGQYMIKIFLNEFYYSVSPTQPNFIDGVKYTLYIRFFITTIPEKISYEHFMYVIPMMPQWLFLKSLYELNFVDDLLEITFSNDLINYKNEPAINLEITFPKNDYNANLIKKMKFGTTFGSEYRIFLAGNPEFPHIDRYNISNDLLGDNVKSQSYEASYFPSKSYRVVGGKNSAINGYVVANDTQLYVTKKYAINDSCLFIRNRVMNESGGVSYFEYKTNIKSPPINEKCLVNFYNDVVMLTDNGLQGIEISSNVLTNERLLKLRSGFINTELKKKIKEAYNIALFEDDERLFIVLDNEIYVADARYAEENPASQVGNVSYEMVKWEITPFIKDAFLHKGKLRFYDDKSAYTLSDTGYDKMILSIDAGEITFDSPEGATVSKEVFDDLKDEQLITFKKISNANVYANIYEQEIGASVLISENFVESFNLRTGLDYFEEGFYVLDGTNFIYKKPQEINTTVTFPLGDKNIYLKINNKSIFVYKEETDKLHFKITQRSDFLSKIVFDTVEIFDNFQLLYEKEKPIEIEWFSGALDLEDKLYEKTMFEITFYVRRLETANLLKYGYRTLRGYKEFSNLENIDLANSISFDEQNYNLFAVTTFDNVAITRKQKENNFLYIQFLFKGEGNIEIGDIIVYYKSNRKVKSVG